MLWVRLADLAFCMEDLHRGENQKAVLAFFGLGVRTFCDAAVKASWNISTAWMKVSSVR